MTTAYIDLDGTLIPSPKGAIAYKRRSDSDGAGGWLYNQEDIANVNPNCSVLNVITSGLVAVLYPEPQEVWDVRSTALGIEWAIYAESIGTDTRGCEVLRGELELDGRKIPFTDFAGSPLHATDSQETLAALVSLVSNGTEHENTGAMLELALRIEEGRCCNYYCVNFWEDKWIRYYDDGGTTVQSLLWGDRIIRENVGSHDEAYNLLDNI